MSLKVTLKAIHAFFASAHVPEVLPDALQRSVNDCVDRESTIDQGSSQRVHEDLLGIYTEFVCKDTSKQSAFLQTLSTFRRFILTLDRKVQWWNLVLEPSINRLAQKKLETEHAIAFLRGLFHYDVDEDTKGELSREAKVFTDLLVETYLRRAKPSVSEDQDYSLENEHLAAQLEQILIVVGKKKPKLLLLTLDSKIVEKDSRIAAFGLLSAFVRHQPPHLYSVSETPLVEHLLQCLMIDTSVTVVQIALTVLIMLLPHIPRSIQTHLSRLFLVYSRLLCWNNENAVEGTAGGEDKDDEDGETVKNISNPAWSKLETPAEREEPASLDLTFYFTFLYGLYPLNFLSFIRKPRRYLKSVHFPRAEELDLDQDLVKSRTETFRQAHLLHPNFFNMTSDEELADDKWLKSDPADVVADCIGLRLSVFPALDTPGPPPSAKLPRLPLSQTATQDIPAQALVGSDDGSSIAVESTSNNSLPLFYTSRHGSGAIKSPVSITQRDAASKAAPARPPRTPNSPSSSTSPAIHSGASPGDSPTLGPVRSPTPRQSPALAPSSGGILKSMSSDARNWERCSKSLLQRQLAILKNDLNFERYLKQQHLAHIGQLQRRHVNDATISANTENLVNTNKSLKSKLSKANDSFTSLQKETSTGRAQSKNFETELSARVRSLREAERQWTEEEEMLRLELAKAQRECDALRQLMVESESRELNSRQQVASAEIELEQVESLRKRVRELEHKVKGFGAREVEFIQAIDEKEMLRVELATAKLERKSQESAHERYRKSTERLIEDLQIKLAQGDGSAQSPEAQKALQTALTASSNRYNALKKDYTRLKHDYVELEARCQELEDVEGAGVGVGNTSGPVKSPKKRPVSFGSDDLPQSGYESSSSWQSGVGGAATAGTNSTHLSRGLMQGQGAPSPATPSRPPESPGHRSSRGSAFSGLGSESNKMYKQQQSAFSMESVKDGNSSDKSKTKVQADSETRVFGRGERVPGFELRQKLQLTFGLPGGTQNVGKNKGAGPEKKPGKRATAKTGGLRSLKGLI